MIFNKTTEYALSVLGFMAMSQDEVFSAEYLHEQLDIPRLYLRKILTELSKSGFVRSTKGRNGGFVFAKPLDEISLADIINKVEGTEVKENCIGGNSKCHAEQLCVMHEVWFEAKSKMVDTLSFTTLLELRNRNEEKKWKNL